jgi:DNA-directed RNA polymerase specialized sigma24 family protein
MKKAKREIPSWDNMTPAKRKAYVNQDVCSHGAVSNFSDLRNEIDVGQISEDAADIFKECADQFTGEVDFDCLSETQNSALSLYYNEGRSYREIAADLGISTDGVKMALRRAKKILVPLYRNSRGK